MLKLGLQPTAAELDARQFLHKNVFDQLIETYGDEDVDDIGKWALPTDSFETTTSVPMLQVLLIPSQQWASQTA